MNLWKIFGIADKQQHGEKNSDLGKLFDGMQEIAKGNSEEDIKLITGFAGLLGKVAYADMEISDVEINRIRSVLSNTLHLSHKQVDSIIELLAKNRVQLFSVEDYLYTRLINAVCDKEQKMDLLKALFTVAAADESVSAEEEAAIRIVSKGLFLSHGDFISIRVQFKEHLDVLK